MKTKYIFLAFIVLVIAQLAIPAQMIFNKEAVLNNGTAYKFVTRPVDPNDPFRGRYITLNYAINSFETSESDWYNKQDVFVYIEEDKNGFASVTQVSKNKLDISQDYVIAKTNWYNENSGVLNFNLQFDRFYMEEGKAPEAEVTFNNAQRDSLLDNTYALVYVKDGDTVLNNVFINDIPIADLVE